MGEYRGSWNITGDMLTFAVNTHSPATGAQTDADSPPSYRIYEDETGTPILTGSMAKLDDANTLGFYSEQVDLDASAPDFEQGKSYNIRIEAIVGGVTGATIMNFQIGADVNLTGVRSVNIVPLTAVTNSTFQEDQVVEVVVGNKGPLFTLSLSGDWTSYSFRYSAKDEPDSSAFAIGPNDVDPSDVVLGADADGNVITTVQIRFAEGDLDIDAAVYTGELTADTGDSSGSELISTLQHPLKVIEGLIG